MKILKDLFTKRQIDVSLTESLKHLDLHLPVNSKYLEDLQENEENIDETDGQPHQHTNLNSFQNCFSSVERAKSVHNAAVSKRFREKTKLSSPLPGLLGKRKSPNMLQLNSGYNEMLGSSTSDYFTDNSMPFVRQLTSAKISQNPGPVQQDLSKGKDFDILQLIKSPVKISSHQCLCKAKKLYQLPTTALSSSQINSLFSKNGNEMSSHQESKVHLNRKRLDNYASFQGQTSDNSRINNWIRDAKNQLANSPQSHFSCPPKLNREEIDIFQILGLSNSQTPDSNCQTGNSNGQSKILNNQISEKSSISQTCEKDLNKMFNRSRVLQKSDHSIVPTKDAAVQTCSCEVSESDRESETVCLPSTIDKNTLKERAFQVWREIQAEISGLNPNDSISSDTGSPLTRSQRSRSTTKSLPPDYSPCSPLDKLLLSSNKNQSEKPSSNSTFTIPSSEPDNNVMFPADYIREFSPSNPRRRDSDSSSVIHQRKLAESLNIRQHLKHFRPRRHIVNSKSNPYSLEAIQETVSNSCQKSELAPNSPFKRFRDGCSFADVQSPSKRVKLFNQNGEDGFYVTSSSVTEFPNDTGKNCADITHTVDKILPQSRQEVIDQGLNPTTSSPRKSIAARASTPVRSLFQSQTLPFDDTISTIFGPPSPEPTDTSMNGSGHGQSLIDSDSNSDSVDLLSSPE